MRLGVLTRSQRARHLQAGRRSFIFRLTLETLESRCVPSNNSGAYHITNLASDQPGVALIQDPDLVNGWGIALNPAGGAFWVSDNGTDVSTLYDGTGTPIPLVVKVAGAPTGDVFNGGPGFVVSHEGDSGPSVFLFATESGTIAGSSVSGPNVATMACIGRTHCRLLPLTDAAPQRIDFGHGNVRTTTWRISAITSMRASSGA